MDPSKVKVPPMMDLTIDNITENAIRVSSQGPNARYKFLIERLITHVHNFARETRLSSEEWMGAINYLTKTGQTCTDVRQEFILLSDVLGLSLLVDAINHPKPPGVTEGTLLGPFHTHEAEDMPNGDNLSHDPKGELCLVVCTVKDKEGNPIEGVKIDIWEADSSGHYDVQYADRDGPDGRCVMRSDKDGIFWFKATKPVPYPIPDDGPVGQLLKALHRHPMRPSHVHFMFEKPGWDHLITALYLNGDPYATSDAVFGVKKSLLFDYQEADEAMAKKYDVKPGTATIKYDFTLITAKESSKLRDAQSMKALEALGRKVKILDGLPVPDVD